MTTEEKARELVNIYYSHAKTQLEAVEICERVVLTTLCKEIDSLHGHVFFRHDFDTPLIESRLKQLKFWQEVALELQRIKQRIHV